jgi:hypothetical protein
MSYVFCCFSEDGRCGLIAAWAAIVEVVVKGRDDVMSGDDVVNVVLAFKNDLVGAKERKDCSMGACATDADQLIWYTVHSTQYAKCKVR